MDQEKLHKLLDLVDKQDQLKIKVLHNAVIKCIDDYRKDPATAKLKAWNAAESALDQFIDDLWGKHFAAKESLANRLAVYEYLSDQGWKVKKSTVYNHRKEGKIRQQKDGTFLVSDVDKYAAANLQRLDGTTEGSEDVDLWQKKKLQAEADKMEAGARLWKKKADVLDGKYVPRDFFERELVKRAAVFKNDIESFIQAKALDIIHLVGGNPTKAPDLIEYMHDQAEDWLDRYAEDREFTIPQMLNEIDFNEKETEDEED
jgi:hypothetical protein